MIKQHVHYAPMRLHEALRPDQRSNPLEPLTDLLAAGMLAEPKLDGNREVIRHHDGEVTITTRGNGERNDYYPAVVRDIPAAVQHHNAVLDGEAVGLRPPRADGPEEQRGLLQRKQKLDLTSGEYHPRVVFYAFDLLELDGERMTHQPHRTRRSRLEELLVPQPSVELCPQYTLEEIDVLLNLVESRHLEGIVLKDPNAPYRVGKRDRAMLKIKLPQQL